jgi:hypothetical protein
MTRVWEIPDEDQGILLKLLVKIDGATSEHQKEGMGSFVVFLSDAQELPGELESAAKKHKFKHLVRSCICHRIGR